MNTPPELTSAQSLIAALRPAAGIFDFDGTLIDTDTINIDAAHATLTDLAVPVPAAWLRQAPLADLTSLRSRLHAAFNHRLPCSDDEFVQRTRANWLARTHRVRPVPRVVSVARQMAAMHLPLAVASANDGQIVRAGLTAAGIGELFTVVIAREHVARLKPAPDAFTAAAAVLSVAPDQCLAFENTDDGITAALAAGVPVIDVRDTVWTVRP